MKQQLNTVSWTAVARISAPLLMMGVSMWMLAEIVELPLLSNVPQSIAALPSGLCLLAAAFCVISLWAVARYDGLAHRHFRTGIPPSLARKSGFAAIAVAQTVGFGLFTGAAVRWRMLPHIRLKSAMQLSAFVSVTFIMALAFLSALTCLFLPAPTGTTLPALSVAIGLPLAVLFLSFAPACAAIRHRIEIPSLRAVRAILGWSALDVLTAALAFYILIPATDLGFATFLPVFLLALSAAMLSGAPGGVGPFELTLISLLPQVPTTDLITAILVFRALYYALPAMLAVFLVFATKQHTPKVSLCNAPASCGQKVAELGILAQNAGYMQQHITGSYALWSTPQTATMLFDPATGRAAPALAHLMAHAAAHTLTACVYKCSSRTALAARRSGWSVVKISHDCLIDLPTYDLAHPDKRGLRRKLRKAQQAGVSVRRATTLPLKDMARIDADWQTTQGLARGGTMGRFCPEYLATQEVYLAHQDGRLIAYVSFHSDPTAPCLDLMRHVARPPDGTMHLLVQTAVETARAEGKPCLSLAAVPHPPRWINRLGSFRRYFENPGLRQFKASFAPAYLPRYAAAPSKTALLLALTDIASEVYRPRPLPTSGKPHEQHEEIEVALPGASWKGELKP